MDEYKVVFMHGFSQEEMARIIRGVKSIVEDPGAVAFCMSTENNLEWKVKDLIADVTEEHDYMKKNPPPGASAGDESPPA
jgi:hypothetical protein